MMRRPAEDRTEKTAGDPESQGPGRVPAWFESRIPAVLVGVVATGSVIAAWKILRHLIG